MNADLLQFILYAGFALLGWWLRHKGFLGPALSPPRADAPAGSADQRALIEMLKALLDRLVQAPGAPPANPASHVITVPFEVAATPRVPASKD
jgi:hypothetical protein